MSEDFFDRADAPGRRLFTRIQTTETEASDTAIAARRAELLDKVKNYHRDVEELTALRLQNNILKSVLEAVDWAFATGKVDSCPICHNWGTAKHRNDCKLNNALKLARGE